LWQADRTAMHIYSVQSGQDLYLKVEILFSILPLCDLFVERRLSNQKHEMILKMMQAYGQVRLRLLLHWAASSM